MPQAETRIREIFKTPARFLRSTNLERDFKDPRALDSYALTPFVIEAFERIAEGASEGSGRRAWRITGDYGVGKSSFALFLARHLSDPKSRATANLLKQAGVAKSRKYRSFIPVLITGDREGLAGTIARAILSTFSSAGRGRPSKAVAALLSASEKASKLGTVAALRTVLDLASAVADQRGKGLLLVLDEMGKFLEHAANHPETEDIFLFQVLAERAVRSGKSPFMIVGLLHQGFQAYAERLPFAQKHEWEKIAGRFEEVVFDQPLVHTAALTAHALGIGVGSLPKGVTLEAKRILRASKEVGWLGRASIVDGDSIYPLHPMVLPVLVRFFARFGQHERSLFGFLLSSEPFGLQEFADAPVSSDTWYRLHNFFDYIRAVFGHRLSGESYRSSWLRLIEIVDRAHELSTQEMAAIKTVAVLNLLDTEDLAASGDVLAVSLGLDGKQTSSVLKGLVEQGLLFRRGQGGDYRLWGSSSVDLRAAFQEALAAIEEESDFAATVSHYLDKRPIAARRHYLTTGTLRYFDIHYTDAASVEAAVAQKPEADGSIIVVLAKNEGERSLANLAAQKSARPDVIVLVSDVLSGLTPDLRDAQAWQHVIANTAELSDDPYSLAEADRQLKRCAAKLSIGLEEAIGLRSTLSRASTIHRSGGKPILPSDRRLAPLLSDVCDELYAQAPIVMNELLNRNCLSSAASAARMRLIEGIFVSPQLPLLGIDEVRAPPEKSMYLSVLAAGKVHRTKGARSFVEDPPKEDDPLRLRPSLGRLMGHLEEAKGARISVETLFAELRAAPFGIRDGVIPLLLAIVVSTHAHEIASYENGTFLHNFGPTDFLRLIKQPDSFELQLCRVAGVRAEVFRLLLECFATEAPTNRQSDLLDVVAPLCKFAANLPEYTRRSTSLDGEAGRVRDALLKSTDPSRLLFHELPEACGIRPFDIDGRRDRVRTEAFVAALHGATQRLRDAYPTLLTDIVADVGRALDAGGGSMDRTKLASRGSRVALAAKEPRLRALAQKLRDPGLSEDGWIESIASFVASKPPARWTNQDVEKWRADIGVLGRTFLGVEAAAFSAGSEPLPSAVRLGLTRADGVERARVVDVAAAEGPEVAPLIVEIDAILAKSRNARVAILYRLLWEALGGNSDVGADAVVEDQRNKSRG
jgi:hypothetical protein